MSEKKELPEGGSAASPDEGDHWYAKPRLGELRMEGGKLIAGWPFVQPVSDVRIYYLLSERKGSGFHYCAVQYAGHECTAADDKLGIDHPEARFDYLLYGWAAFDGIRHLYVRDGDEAGYINYPHLDDLIAVLKALRTLELEHCWDAGPRKPERGHP